jgi:NMD protein affecting ribosome stability and mRNA decay
MGTTLLTACHRCKRQRPRYAKGLCRSCYALRLYYVRQGRPLPPYRVRVRRCRGCGEIMRRRAMCIVMTAVVTVRHNGAVYVERLGSSDPGVPGLGT